MVQRRGLLASRFSTTAFVGSGYDATAHNMLINKETRVICQGFTGKQVGIVYYYY